MGNNLQCHIGESEEEIIERIFSSIPFNDIQVQEVYSQYNDCMITCEGGKDIELDYFKYSTMINKIINKENNNCKLIHLDYFDMLRKIDQCILCIGAILIYISKGSKEEKISLLSDHYANYSGDYTKEGISSFIMKIIKANTDICVCASDNGKESSKKMIEVYDDNRKTKLANYIMMNYDLLISKKNKGKPKLNRRLTNELFELIFPLLKGEFIRNWLSEEYEKDRPKVETNPCLF